MTPPTRTRAFTLVELLIVMGIISLLLLLLFPAVTTAISMVQTIRTANTISQLSVALESFYKDFGTYPPSDDAHEEEIAGTQAVETGYGNVAAFLTNTLEDNNQTWGPYFTSEAMAAGGSNVLDGFSPPAKIFYFRHHPIDGDEAYDWEDNDTDSDRAKKGFASEGQFLLLAKRRGPGEGNNPSNWSNWAREDYLLISPGPDRLYGHVREDPTKDYYVPATYSSEDRWCDDVTNFSYN